MREDRERDLNALADYLGYTFEEAKRTLERAAPKAERETTGRAAAEPRRKTIADAKAEALAIGDTTLLGQLVKYEERLASSRTSSRRFEVA